MKKYAYSNKKAEDFRMNKYVLNDLVFIEKDQRLHLVHQKLKKNIS